MKNPRILRAAPVALSIFVVSLSTFAFADKPPAPREQAQNIDAIVRLVTDALRAYQRPDQPAAKAPERPGMGPDQDRTCPWRVEKPVQPPRLEQPGWGRGPQGKGGEGPGWGGGPQNRERERQGWDRGEQGRGQVGPGRGYGSQNRERERRGWDGEQPGKGPGPQDKGHEQPGMERGPQGGDKGPQGEEPGEHGRPGPER
ncbi:hypothetical protein LLH03_20515 [bacterium]|nr:hypothetical protein [bacterium]